MILIDKATCFLPILSMLTHILEMYCFISTVQLFMAARCFQCLETMQEVYTAWGIAVCRCGKYLGPHTVYFSHIWMGIWILNYGFPEDALGFCNEIR